METENIKKCADELKALVELASAKGLSSKIQIGSYSKREDGFYGDYAKFDGSLFLTSGGLKEVIKYLAELHYVGRPDYGDIPERDVPPSEFETIVTKYSITEEKLREIRSKLKNNEPQ